MLSLRTNITLILFLTLVMYSTTASSQRNKYWYFGINAGLRFDSNNVVTEIMNSPLLAFLQSTTMSNEQGDYLYFSNGISVSNKYHQTMLNGTGLICSSISGGENCVSVPLPNSDSLYYIFHRYHGGEPIKYNESDTGYYYSIIDMSKDGGNGDVISKNNLILHRKGYSMSIIQHANNIDFWIVLKPCYSNDIYAYLLTQAGLSTTPVTTNCQTLSNHITFQSSYFIEGGRWILGSPDSKILAICPIYSSNPSLRATGLFQFNNQTGAVSNPLLISSIDSTNIVAFSPDSKRLYLANSPISGGNFLTQLTLRHYDSTAIANSATTIAGGSNNILYQGYGQGSIASNGKLYISKYGNTLSVVNNPNDSAMSCNFQENGLTLNHSFFKFLPHFWNTVNHNTTSIYIQPKGCNKFIFNFRSNVRGLTYKEWQFGDGTAISHDSIATHIYYINADTVLVKFKIVQVGKTDTIFANYRLPLHKKPLATISIVNNGCIKDSVSFNANINLFNNVPTKTIFWNFGNGSTAIDISNPKKLYTDTGIYLIKLCVTDTLNCISDTALQSIVVNKKLLAGFGISNTICTNKSIIITDSSKAYNTNIYQWYYFLSNGASWIDNTNNNISYLINTAGNYTLKQVVSNNSGCISDTAVKNFVVHSKPQSSFLLPQSCIKDTSVFINTSIPPLADNIVNSFWQFNDSYSNNQNPDTSVEVNSKHRFTQAATYLIKLISYTNWGCSDTASQNFSVNGAIPVSTIFLPTQNYCSNDSITLINNSSVDFGLLTQAKWLFNNTDSFIINNPIANTIHKKYFGIFGMPEFKLIPIKLTVKSGVNCISTKDTNIVIKAHPKLAFANMNNICMNVLPYYINNASVTNGALGLGWYSGAGVIDSVGLFLPKLISPNVSSTILYTYKTTLGCIDTISNNIIVLDTPKIITEKNKIVLEGGQVTLYATANGSSNLNFNWQPNIALDDNHILTPKASPNNDVVYKITVVQNNGCKAFDTVLVKVLKKLIIPNVFSPNGDGINDVWQIPYLNTYQNAKLFLFNRDGKIVYQTIGYYKPFDGSKNGKPLPDGSYFYIIETGNGRNPYSGVVTILR